MKKSIDFLYHSSVVFHFMLQCTYPHQAAGVQLTVNGCTYIDTVHNDGLDGHTQYIGDVHGNTDPYPSVPVNASTVPEISNSTQWN
jgi:hypothetical protein